MDANAQRLDGQQLLFDLDHHPHDDDHGHPYDDDHDHPDDYDDDYGDDDCDDNILPMNIMQFLVIRGVC